VPTLRESGVDLTMTLWRGIAARQRVHKGENPLASALGFSEPDFVLADLPRSNLTKITDLFDRYIIMEDVELEDVSDRLGGFSLDENFLSSLVLLSRSPFL